MKKEMRPRISSSEYELLREWREDKLDNTLVIGDLHAPFVKKGYLEFCIEMYEYWKCNRVVFIGDIIDNHFSSFHEASPDGHSAAMELQLAREQIAGFYEAFPDAYVCLGNHDLIPDRKRFSAGLSESWVRSVGEVMDTPRWKYAEEWEFDGVLYTHGVGRKAKPRCMQEFKSIVQGHYHSESLVEYFCNDEKLLFALQVGCGVDRKSYAMAYAKNFKKPQLNVGIVADSGRKAFIEPMRLGGAA